MTQEQREHIVTTKCQLRAALDELYIQGVEGTENECPYFQI